MNEHTNPEKIYPPFGMYSHTVNVPAGAEWLVVSGQVGVDAKGELANGLQKQSEQALKNVLACLKAGSMNKSHLVKMTVYLTDPRGVQEFRAARSKVLGDEVRPTSTLVCVTGLAAPEWLVEVEAWAAK